MERGFKIRRVEEPGACSRGSPGITAFSVKIPLSWPPHQGTLKTLVSASTLLSALAQDKQVIQSVVSVFTVPGAPPGHCVSQKAVQEDEVTQS